VKERMIICNADEVRALLDGQPVELRRVVKDRAHSVEYYSCYGDSFGGLTVKDGYLWHSNTLQSDLPEHREAWLAKCPYGQPGDRLWVRETWAINRLFDDVPPRHIEDGEDGLWWRADKSSLRPLNAKPGRWRPSTHMPRWASRITLEVASVRVEKNAAGIWEWVIEFRRVP